MNTSAHIKLLKPYLQGLFSALEEIKHGAPDDFQSLFSFIKREVIALPVLNKIGWEVKASDPTKFNIGKLRLFYFLLVQFKFIVEECTSFETFASHFIEANNPVQDKIQWMGNNYALPVLVLALIQHRIIPEVGNRFDIIRVHFTDYKGHEFKRGSLETQSSRGGLIEETKIQDIVTFLNSNS